MFINVWYVDNCYNSHNISIITPQFLPYLPNDILKSIFRFHSVPIKFLLCSSKLASPFSYLKFFVQFFLVQYLLSITMFLTLHFQSNYFSQFIHALRKQHFCPNLPSTRKPPQVFLSIFPCVYVNYIMNVYYSSLLP